ncbi:hypothetical protein BASA82_000062 [Batrachochytrium salamandrivorans]|nr:hypothetical protein BASA81_000162 [Batrachochytrium salamandrivorans]KAH9262923.1 hypothetical protein BASA82_000062 [Batrachochytrium salamandrivorans]
MIVCDCGFVASNAARRHHTMDQNMLTLVSSEGREFTVTEREAGVSARLKPYFSETAEFADCKQKRCVLPFNSQVLDTVVRYLQHKSVAVGREREDEGEFEIPPEILVEVASAARYLLI